MILIANLLKKVQSRASFVVFLLSAMLISFSAAESAFLPERDGIALAEVAGYRYEVSPTGWQCGTQGPGAAIIKAKFEPDNATGKIRVTVGKCNGTNFSTSGTFRIVLDDTGRFQNWRYRTSTTGYRCGGIIEFKLETRSSDVELRGTARKCAGGNFSSPGKMYIYADGNRIAGPDSYGTNQSSESITFTPVELSSPLPGRHTYQAYFQSDNNSPGDYIISGSVDAWEEYHSYLNISEQITAGQPEYSFLFDPRALGYSGTHKYQVHFYSGNQTYPNRSGIISAWDVTVPDPDAYEPDNDFTQSKTISTNGNGQTHTFHVPGDEDWMKFDAQTGYTYVIETYNLQGGADTVLALFWDDQNDGHPDLIDSDTSAGTSRIQWTADASAVRWVKVRDNNTNLGGTNVQYSVKITASAPQGDQYEPDNDFTQAKSIATNGVGQTHTIHLAGDEDWMKFDAVSGYTYVIETYNLQGGADSVLGLFWDDQNDGHPDLIDSDTSAGTSRIQWTADTSAVRWLKVRDNNTSLGGTGVQYSVKVTASAPQGDQYEPDDDFTQATSIATNGVGQTHTIHAAGDEDWMKFDAVSGYTYVIETYNLQGGADTLIGLFWDENDDNHPDLISRDDDGGTGAASRIEWVATQNGLRYIKVRDYNPTKGGIDASYDIRVTAEALISQGDQYEFDNSFHQSSSIATDGSVQTHTIHQPGDEDWIKFDAQIGYRYVIETSNLQGGVDTLIGLFWDENNDNHPDLILRDDNGGNGVASRIDWIASHSGTRYIKVRDTNANMGDPGSIYDIQITSSAPLPENDKRVIHLSISLYRTPTESEKTAYEAIIGFFADGIFEMTNGVHRVGHVSIYQGGEFNNVADVVWNEKEWPRAYVSGYFSHGRPVYMGDIFPFDGGDYNALNSSNWCGAGYTLAHEWGHYFYGLLDEYAKKEGDINANPAVMASQWSACDGLLNALNFSTPLSVKGPHDNWRAYQSSSWEVLARPRSEDPNTDWKQRGTPRQFFSDLAGVATLDHTLPPVELPDNTSRGVLRIDWIQSQGTQLRQSLGAVYTPFIFSTLGSLMVANTPTTIVAGVTNDNAPLADIFLQAIVTHPDGAVTEMLLQDDGTPPDLSAQDGQYTSLFSFSQEGEYLVAVTMDNRNSAAVETKSSYQHTPPKYGKYYEDLPHSTPPAIAEEFSFSQQIYICVNTCRLAGEDPHEIYLPVITGK